LSSIEVPQRLAGSRVCGLKGTGIAPENNEPLAMAMVPPEERSAPVCGYFQAIEFVSRLNAIRTFCEVSPGMRLPPAR
jgi:hypothetical protein